VVLNGLSYATATQLLTVSLHGILPDGNYHATVFAGGITDQGGNSMAADYGFDQLDAYMMLSQCGRVRLGNFVDPKYTVGAAVLKKYLP